MVTGGDGCSRGCDRFVGVHEFEMVCQGVNGKDESRLIVVIFDVSKVISQKERKKR